MTYKDAIRLANTEYARAERANEDGILRPVDEQLIVGRLINNLNRGEPSYPIRPNTGGPTAPPSGDTEAPYYQERKCA